MSKTKSFDMDSYIEHITNGPCFICEMLDGNPEYPHHIIYKDARAVVFLNKFPVFMAMHWLRPQNIESK